MLELNKIYEMEAIEFLKQIDNKIVDMILCDLPYGITACEWDIPIDLNLLWQEYKRIIKDNGAIVLTASQPFTTDLINSNREWFKYELIWYKNTPSIFVTADKRPLKYHENILIFYKNQPIYNPQLHKVNSKSSKERRKYNLKSGFGSEHHLNLKSVKERYNPNYKNPESVIVIKSQPNHKGKLHSTQKPLSLFRYLIKTYTNEDNLVIDNCVGSGTTAIACKQLNRRFLCCDINKDYVEITNKRLQQETLLTRGQNFTQNSDGVLVSADTPLIRILQNKIIHNA